MSREGSPRHGRLEAHLRRRARWRWPEIAFWLALLAAIFAVPSRAALINEILVAGLFALSLDLILGLRGIVSLGQAAFSRPRRLLPPAILANAGLRRPDCSGSSSARRSPPSLGLVTAPLLAARLGPDAPHGDARRLADARRTRQPHRLADRRRGRPQLLDGQGARPLPDRLHRPAQRRALQPRRSLRPVRHRAPARAIAVRPRAAAIRENRAARRRARHRDRPAHRRDLYRLGGLCRRGRGAARADDADRRRSTSSISTARPT